MDPIQLQIAIPAQVSVPGGLRPATPGPLTAFADALDGVGLARIELGRVEGLRSLALYHGVDPWAWLAAWAANFRQTPVSVWLDGPSLLGGMPVDDSAAAKAGEFLVDSGIKTICISSPVNDPAFLAPRIKLFAGLGLAVEGVHFIDDSKPAAVCKSWASVGVNRVWIRNGLAGFEQSSLDTWFAKKPKALHGVEINGDPSMAKPVYDTLPSGMIASAGLSLGAGPVGLLQAMDIPDVQERFGVDPQGLRKAGDLFAEWMVSKGDDCAMIPLTGLLRMKHRLMRLWPSSEIVEKSGWLDQTLEMLENMGNPPASTVLGSALLAEATGSDSGSGMALLQGGCYGKWHWQKTGPEISCDVTPAGLPEEDQPVQAVTGLIFPSVDVPLVGPDELSAGVLRSGGKLGDMLRVMDELNLDELDVEQDGQKFAFKRNVPVAAGTLHAVLPQVPMTRSDLPVAGKEKQRPSPKNSDAHKIESPIAGTFYRAASPGSEPFVREGDMVDPDRVVCIVEAMKNMNEIKAGVSGIIESVEIENEGLVQAGDVMFLVKKS